MTDFIGLLEKFAATQYAYHIKPGVFRGKQILPLSMLEPHEQRMALQKYDDRTKWIRRAIPPLNCTAMDIVNLSMVNPIKLLTMMALLDVEKMDSHDIWKIPVRSLSRDMVIAQDDNGKDRYVKTSPSKYVEISAVPLENVEHYMESKCNKESPLIFEGVPHLLVKGPVDISGAELLKFRPRELERWMTGHN